MRSIICLLTICAFTGAMRPQLDGRIVGGESVNIEILPYQLSLENSGRFICGASIINEYWALTAAHCVWRDSIFSISLRAGSNITRDGGILHKVTRIVTHPSYNPNTMVYDYAVVKVSTPFKYNSAVQAVSLPEGGTEPSEGILATASGWGILATGGNLPSKLQKVDVPIVSRIKCSEALGEIDDTMICAGYPEGGKDSCQGDSGGPLVSNGIQIGVVSWGYGCADPGSPGVYSNLGYNSARKWIQLRTGV